MNEHPAVANRGDHNKRTETVCHLKKRTVLRFFSAHSCSPNDRQPVSREIFFSEAGRMIASRVSASALRASRRLKNSNGACCHDDSPYTKRCCWIFFPSVYLIIRMIVQISLFRFRTRNFGVAYFAFPWYTLYRQLSGCL